MFPYLMRYQDIAILVLRLMVGVVFISSGWSHLKDPGGRSKSIGMSRNFTVFLGAAEVGGSLGVIFGVFSQLAALGLIFSCSVPFKRKFSPGILAFGARTVTAGTTT